MKNSYLNTLVRGSILNSNRGLEKIARQTGWLVRAPKKLKPIDFVRGMLLAVSQGESSFRLLASAIGLGLKSKRSESEDAPSQYDTISKPALWERVNPEAVNFLKETLAQLLKEKKFAHHGVPALASVYRIIIEDSTKVILSDRLLEEFYATNNQHGVAGAGLRFQFALDLMSGETVRADLTRYGRTDSKAACDIVEILVEGDLLIRDLGYFVIDSFRSIVDKGAHFLSRYLSGRVIYHSDENGGQRIDLLKHLQKHAPECGDTVDLDIMMGLATEKRTPQMTCRLVARRVSQQVEEKRQRRIKKDEKRLGKQRSKTFKKLQGWEIYITSLDREEAPVEKLCELYPLRWRVEIIFKACKTYTPIKELAAHQSNSHHVQCLLYAWLCLLVLATRTTAFALVKKSSPCDGGRLTPNLLSLLKVVPRVFQMLNAALFMSSAPITEVIDRWLYQMSYHDRYEKRKNRTNMAEKLGAALDLEMGLGESSRELLT